MMQIKRTMNEEQGDDKLSTMELEDGASSTVNTTHEGSSGRLCHQQSLTQPPLGDISPTSVVLFPVHENCFTVHQENNSKLYESSALYLKDSTQHRDGRKHKEPYKPRRWETRTHLHHELCSIGRKRVDDPYQSLRSIDIIQQLESLLNEARQLLTVHSSLRQNRHLAIDNLIEKVNEIAKLSVERDKEEKEDTVSKVNTTTWMESSKVIQVYLLEIRTILLELRDQNVLVQEHKHNDGTIVPTKDDELERRKRSAMVGCLLGIEQKRVQALENALETISYQLHYTKGSYETLCKVHDIETRALRENHDNTVTMMQRGIDSKDQLIVILMERINAATDPNSSVNGVLALKNETIRRKDRRIEVLQQELKRCEIDISVLKREKQIAQETFHRETNATIMMYEDLLDQLRKDVNVHHGEEVNLSMELHRTQEKLQYVQKQNSFERRAALVKEKEHKRTLMELEKTHTTALRDRIKEVKVKDDEIQKLNDIINQMKVTKGIVVNIPDGT